MERFLKRYTLNSQNIQFAENNQYVKKLIHQCSLILSSKEKKDETNI